MTTLAIDGTSIALSVADNSVEIVSVAQQGPPGPGSNVPDPADANNGEMLAAADGAWIIVPAPAGTGDMQSLIYDPQGRATNVFDIGNLTGVIDGGVFT